MMTKYDISLLRFLFFKGLGVKKNWSRKISFSIGFSQSFGLVTPYLVYLGTYLSALNMVKWGIPEKILQNVVQTRSF